MKPYRLSCFVLTALIGCSSGPVDLGDPGVKDDVPLDPGRDGDHNDRPGDVEQDPGPKNPDTSTPANAPETVLEATSLAEVDEIRSFDLAGGKLFYSGAHDNSISLYRYDIASKANVLVARDHGGAPFAADENGFFYAGLTAYPVVQKAVVGMPLTSTTHAPEWFSSYETIATAVAVDPGKVYWIERGELHTFFRIANRTAFTLPPSPAYAFGPSVPNNSETFEHLVIDQGVGYTAGDRGRLVRFDMEIATTVLTSGGPKSGFVLDDSNLYWVDGTDLKALPKGAPAGSSPSVITSLPSDATNVLGGAGPKGVYVLSQPSAGADSGKVLRIDPATGTPTELVTKLGGLRAGAFIEKSLYFVTSKGVLRLKDG